MKLLTKNLRAQGVAAALLLSMTGTVTHAATVTQPLLESTTLVTGTTLTLTEFNLAAPGSLLIELNDLKWPAAFESLSFSLSDATHIFQTFTANNVAGTNSWTFDINTAGTFYGAIFAKPTTSSKAGMYYANVSYNSVSPVPLPAAAWLLLSGIAGLAAVRPQHKLSQLSA